MNTPVSKVSIPQLNGFRGMAIGMVVFYHMALNTSIYPVKLINEGGWMAVQLFFVLSGFLLSLEYIQYALMKEDCPSPFRFYKKRVVRIFPLYFFSLVIYIIYGYFNESLPSLKELLSHFIFLENIYGTSSLYGPYWSLAVEVQVYLLFPLLGYVIHKKLSYGKINSLLVFLFLLVIAPLLYRIVISQFYCTTNTDYITYIYQSSISNLDSFVWGVIGALIYSFRITEKLPVKVGWALLATTIGVVVWLFYFSFKKGGWLLSYGMFAPGLFYTIINLTWLLMIISTLILKNNWVSSIFTNKWIGFVSLISFSIYVWHGLMIDVVLNLTTYFKIEYKIVIVFISFGLILSSSYLSYIIIELPFLKRRSKIFNPIVLLRN